MVIKFNDVFILVVWYNRKIAVDEPQAVSHYKSQLSKLSGLFLCQKLRKRRNLELCGVRYSAWEGIVMCA